MNYYEALKIPRQASFVEIKKAYRERMRECHPDRVHNLDEDFQKMAQEKVIKINEAYHVLSKPDQKAEYDKSLLEQENAIARVEEREKFGEKGKESEKPEKKSIVVDAFLKTIEEKFGEKEKESEKHEKKSIVVEAFLKIIEEKIKSQNEAVNWSRGNTKDFNLTLEGSKRMEEYTIYLKAFSQLGEKDLKSVINQMRRLNIKPTKLWATRFTTICLVAEGFSDLGAIKEMVKKYNSQQQETGAKQKREKSIITIVDMTTRKVFSPFSANFKPHLRNI